MNYLAPVTRTGRRAASAAAALLFPILLVSAVCSPAELAAAQSEIPY